MPAPGLRRPKTGGPALLRDYLLAKTGLRCAAPPPTRYFKSVGMAVFDAIAARNVYLAAQAKGSGAGPGVTCLTHPAGGRQKSPQDFLKFLTFPIDKPGGYPLSCRK